MKLVLAQWRWIFCATVCVVLAAVVAVLIDLLLLQWRPTLYLDCKAELTSLSERSQATLAETSGTISIASLLPSTSPAKRPIGFLLKQFEHFSRERSGATIEIHTLDPYEEPQRVKEFLPAGNADLGLFVKQSGKSIFIPEQALLSETEVYSAATAEEALTMALARLSRVNDLTIGWLQGHGEASYTTTDPQHGYSGLYRALENEGYTLCNFQCDVTTEAIPTNLKLIIIAEPRYPIPPTERRQLIDWLDRGGRIMCFLPADNATGLEALFEPWGIQMGEMPHVGMTRSISGATLTQQLNETHAITSELAGKTTVACRAPKVFYPFNVRGITHIPLIQMAASSMPTEKVSDAGEASLTIALAAERESTISETLGFTPGRLVLFGDAAFATNQHLLNRATANREIILNAVHWLSGVSGSGAKGATDCLTLGVDRETWQRHVCVLGILFPITFCLLLKLFAWRTP